MINKDTQVCISIAERPSNFGTTLHNAAFKALDLNFIYKAFSTNDLEGAIKGVRALGIRGCSISMPFKQSVISFVDDLDESSHITGAINTIVNNSGYLTGYNTDLIAARLVLSSLNLKPESHILILGAGGVARAILSALNQLHYRNVTVASRDLKKVSLLKSIMAFRAIPWEAREKYPVQILINATPIGMSPEDGFMPVSEAFIASTLAVMDVIVSPMETKLIFNAGKAGKRIIPGYQLSLEQAAAQFLLYTGIAAPRAVLESTVSSLMRD